MVTLKPGFIPNTYLTHVWSDTYLLNSTAMAWRKMVMVAQLDDGTTIRPAGPGSGYRSWAVALEFYKAGQGDQALRKKWEIASDLQVSIAYPPGTHGTGTRIDMLFNGHSPDEHNIELAKRYGFIREFGTRDANHFQHDRITAIHGVRSFDKIRLTARFLNEQHLGRTTKAATTGIRDADLIWLAQRWGHLKSTYPKSCLEDGITGKFTELSLTSTWEAIYQPTWRFLVGI